MGRMRPFVDFASCWITSFDFCCTIVFYERLGRPSGLSRNPAAADPGMFEERVGAMPPTPTGLVSAT